LEFEAVEMMQRRRRFQEERRKAEDLSLDFKRVMGVEVGRTAGGGKGDTGREEKERKNQGREKGAQFTALVTVETFRCRSQKKTYRGKSGC